MTDSPDIVGKVKEHLDRYEVVPTLSETRVKHIHDVYGDFPKIAESLLIAEEALRWYESEYENGIGCKAEEALSQIRSL